MFVAPGPIDEVTAIAFLRRIVLAQAIAAWAMVCSFWPRQVGSASPMPCSASPIPAT
jgi:hypothetical protein